MAKRGVTVLVALVFAFSCVFMLASCAKKQIGVEETAVPAAPVVEKAPPKEPPKEVVAEITEEERARRAMEEKMRAMVSEFEAETIHFDFDKYNLKPEAQEILKKKAAFLRANTEYSLLIEGHCDERGTQEYNLALGERRANSAKQYLMALGISEDRIKTISYGKLRPADPASNEAAWAKNRRDEFRLFK